MTDTGSDADAGFDLDAVLDRALEAPKPKGRPPTKTEQLRERREKLIALQAKGYTEMELAEMAGVSKDTLRKALRPAKVSAKPRKGSRAAHSAQPIANGDTEANAVVSVPKVAAAKVDSSEFPTNSRF